MTPPPLPPRPTLNPFSAMRRLYLHLLWLLFVKAGSLLFRYTHAWHKDESVIAIAFSDKEEFFDHVGKEFARDNPE